MPGSLTEFWQYLKEHDAPNWFGIFISLFVWPPILALALYWWSNLKIQSVPHFRVTFTPSRITIGGPLGAADYDAVQFDFINQTGSTVYLHHAVLKEVENRFPIPPAASRDMARGWRELVFALPADIKFNRYECILQTNERVLASVAVETPMDDVFYAHRPGIFRRWFNCPKYFRLDYVVMVGETKFSISTIY